MRTWEYAVLGILFLESDDGLTMRQIAARCKLPLRVTRKAVYQLFYEGHIWCFDGHWRIQRFAIPSSAGN